MIKDKSRSPGFGIYVAIFTFILLMILIALNYLVTLLPSGIRRIDTTKLGLSSLSEVTVGYLKDLDEDITVAHVCIYGEEDETVRDLLAKYGESSPHIKVKQVDPAVDPSFTAKYTSEVLDNNSVIVIGSKRAKVIDYNDLFTFALYYNNIPQGEMSYSDFMTFYEYYSSRFETDFSYDTMFAGEYAITSAIDYVTSEQLPTVYYLTGHGENALPDQLVSDLELDNIAVRELSLITSAIPDDCGAVIINSPLSDISASEYDILDSYLSGSGDLLLITDKEYLELPNLMKLMSDRGMSAESRYVCDTSPHVLGLVYMIVADSSGASSLLDISGYSAVTPLAHPIIIDSGASGSGVAYIRLFKTSESAYTVEEFSDGEYESDESETKQDYNVGVLASIDNSGETAHVVWISSPGFVSDEINSNSVGGNYVYLISLIEKLTGKSSSLALASKTMVEDSLIMDSAQSYFWTFVLCALIPGGVMMVGIIVSVRRKRG